jgi:hypothetical protein
MAWGVQCVAPMSDPRRPGVFVYPPPNPWMAEPTPPAAAGARDLPQGTPWPRSPEPAENPHAPVPTPVPTTLITSTAVDDSALAATALFGVVALGLALFLFHCFTQIELGNAGAEGVWRPLVALHGLVGRWPVPIAFGVFGAILTSTGTVGLLRR